MSTKFLAATVSVVALMAAAGANAHDSRYHSERHYNDGAYDNAAIQKGGSASTKAYGENKQGDHYATDPRRNDSAWEQRHTYPGERVAFGTKSDQLVQKGGSAISDPMMNAQADSRPYGTYWK